MRPVPRHSPDDLWAITSYFNPAGYRRRLANYRTFARHLDVPLLTVELAFDDDFELGADDADILVQLRGGDVMWQKERLLNIALRALPPDCRKVAAIDCDLVFESSDWAARTSRILDSVTLVQPFSHAFWTPPGWQPGGAVDPGDFVFRSAGYLIDAGMPSDAAVCGRGDEIRCAHGMAWAARRSLWETYGFYDANIVGGGDTSLFRAAFGYPDLVVERFEMDRRRARHFRAWAEPLYDAVKGDVGYVAGDIYHLWHGAFQDRRYVERYHRLAALGFDPDADIALGDSGVWRWNTDKPELHAFVRGYFPSRNEDA
jgi:hypothetical protein